MQGRKTRGSKVDGGDAAGLGRVWGFYCLRPSLPDHPGPGAPPPPQQDLLSRGTWTWAAGRLPSSEARVSQQPRWTRGEGAVTAVPCARPPLQAVAASSPRGKSTEGRRLR